MLVVEINSTGPEILLRSITLPMRRTVSARATMAGPAVGRGEDGGESGRLWRRVSALAIDSDIVVVLSMAPVWYVACVLVGYVGGRL